ncbi:MAG: 2-phospho-L-lactate transferase [Candidatus Binatia bacterium]
MRIAILTGGTGGAKLVQGLSQEINPEDVVIICNTADDFVMYGLHISPDLDTITYTLAGINDAGRGWGIRDDTFVTLEELGRYQRETWFKIGDRDLATHITRSALLREGLTLSQVTERIRKALGVRSTVVPMSDNTIETRIVTPKEEISFQEYFVRDHWVDEVKKLFFAGATESRPAPGVIDAIREASAVILCPSNPVTSIGPILAVPEVKRALKTTEATIVAVSPIIHGAPVSGPAHKLMAAIGLEVSAFGVAKTYADFLDMILVAKEDSNLQARIEGLGVKTVVSSIRMDSSSDQRRLARKILNLLQ